MKRILTAAALVALTAFATAPSFAAAAATTMKPAAAAPVKMAAATPAKPAKAAPLTFKLIDANHDGKISFDELKKYFPKVTKAEFAKYAGKDGFLDHTGLAAFVKAQTPAPAKPAATK